MTTERINYIKLTRKVCQPFTPDLKAHMQPAIDNVAVFDGDPYSSRARTKFRSFMIFYLIYKIQTQNLPKSYYGEFLTRIPTKKLIEESEKLYNEQKQLKEGIQ